MAYLTVFMLFYYTTLLYNLSSGRGENRTPVLQCLGSAVTCVPVFFVSGKTSRLASIKDQAFALVRPSSMPDNSGIPA